MHGILYNVMYYVRMYTVSVCVSVCMPESVCMCIEIYSTDTTRT